MTESAELNGRQIDYTDWFGLYKERWVNKPTAKDKRIDVSPQSIAHPAKFSRALIRRIYAHFIEKGYLKAGNCVIDPFGGVALGSLDALSNGINWVGIEVEPRFVTFGAGGECDGKPVEIGENTDNVIEGWYIIFEDEDGCTQFVDFSGEVSQIPIENGFNSKDEAHEWLDSLGEDEGFEDISNLRIEHKKYGKATKIVKAALCGSKEEHEPHHIKGNIELFEENYGGKLGKWGKAVLLNGDSRYLVKVLRDNADRLPCSGADGATTSPPYNLPFSQEHSGRGGGSRGDTPSEDGAFAKYGSAEGQIEGLPDEGFDTAIASPPYEPDALGHGGKPSETDIEKGLHARIGEGVYGREDGQIGSMPTGEIDAALTSPPFLQTSGGTNVTSKDGPLADERLINRHAAGNAAQHAYGENEGQLQSMEEGEFDAALSSPPFTGVSSDGGWQMLGKYAEEGKLTVAQVEGDPNKSYPSWSKERDTSYGKSGGQLAEMEEGSVDAAITSPPYAETQILNFTGKKSASEQSYSSKVIGDDVGYGDQEAQLGAMPNEGFDAALTSPPYAETRIDGNGDEGASNLRNPDGSFLRGSEGWELRKAMGGRYGDTDGQLGDLKDDGFDGSLTSPPFEAVTSDHPSASIIESGLKMGASSMGDGYGTSEGQTGAMSGDNFWGASRMIMDGLYQVIKPGGKKVPDVDGVEYCDGE